MRGRRFHALPPRLGKLMPMAVLSLLATSCWSRYQRGDDPMARHMRVHNLSDSTVDVYWMNLQTEERVFQFELVPGKTDGLNTHVIHEFEIVEKPNGKAGKCGGKNGLCRKRHFQISEFEDQLFTLNSDFKVTETNSQSRAKQRARDVLEKCRDLREKLKNDADYGSLSPLDQLDLLTQCLQRHVHDSLVESHEVIHYDSTIRSHMSSKLALYACHDKSYPESEAIYTSEWERIGDEMDDKNHTMKMYFELDATIIATVDNVLTPSDCQTIHDMALLDDAGTPTIQWAPSENPQMGRILSKIYKYINPALKYKGLSVGMPEQGQRLIELRYNKTLPIHTNESWSVNGASIVGRIFIFCEAPVEGGAIHFLESGTHIYPQPGQALLMTYTLPSSSQDAWNGPGTNFRNTHVDCPMVDGNLTAVEHVFRLYF